MSCRCSFPWAGPCIDCNERADRLAADPIHDVCSSECDYACAANDHCNRINDNYCSCKSCQAHDLDEDPPKETDEL